MLAKNPKQAHPLGNGLLHLENNVTLKGTSVIYFLKSALQRIIVYSTKFKVFHWSIMSA